MERLKILFIEDNHETAELVIDYLYINNYIVTYCDTLIEGLSYLKNVNFDVLLLDLNLPDSFGLDIYKKINKNNLPYIIVTSAHSEIDIKMKAFNLGVDDYICKPYNLDELNARIKLVLKRRAVKEDKKEDTFHIKDNSIFLKKDKLELTKMELLILKELMKSKNSIVRREFLLDIFNLPEDSRSIDYHIKNIRQKIHNKQKDSNYLQAQYGIGYKLIY